MGSKKKSTDVEDMYLIKTFVENGIEVIFFFFLMFGVILRKFKKLKILEYFVRQLFYLQKYFSFDFLITRKYI